MNGAHKFTPGPWQIDDGDSAAFGIFDQDGQAVAYLTESAIGGHGLRGRAEDEANARVIAAAPDMHEALTEMVTWALKMCRVPRPESPIEKARAALAKAVGR